jgi:uncharacterized short protein YbdD (DUF466 family)
MADARTEQVAAAREERFLALLRAGGGPEVGASLFGQDAPASDGLLRPMTAPSPPRVGRHLRDFLWRMAWRAWQLTRQLSGDDAYERYLEHMARAHPGQAPMSPAEHYKFRQDEKWNRLSRCC